MNELDNLADETPIWIFGASRQMTEEEVRAVGEAAERFVAGWKSHGSPVKGAAKVIDRQFLLFALDGESSGCSIDSLYEFVGVVEKHLDTELLNPSRLFFRRATGEIVATDRATFRQLASDGEVTAATEVFNPAVATVGEARRGWRVAAADSWHRQYLQ